MKAAPCMEWIEELEAAAAGEPSPTLADHLDACPGCRDELAVLRALAVPLARLALEEPSASFSAAVVDKVQRSLQPNWLAPAALLLAGGAGGTAALAAVCVLALWLWLGTERIVTAAGFLAADFTGGLSALLDPVAVPEIATLGIAATVAAVAAFALVGIAKAASASRQLTPR